MDAAAIPLAIDAAGAMAHLLKSVESTFDVAVGGGSVFTNVGHERTGVVFVVFAIVKHGRFLFQSKYTGAEAADHETPSSCGFMAGEATSPRECLLCGAAARGGYYSIEYVD
jgi:hypothetical protein